MTYRPGQALRDAADRGLEEALKAELYGSPVGGAPIAPPIKSTPAAGVKHDTEKPPMHLVAWDAVVPVMEADLFHNCSYHVVDLFNVFGPWWHGEDRGHLMQALQVSLSLAGDGSPWRGLVEVARVLDFGAKKYAPRNWEKGLAHSRTFAAAMRHLCARAGGETLDPETGLDHYAHAACEIMFALAFEVRGRTDLDDRPKP